MVIDQEDVQIMMASVYQPCWSDTTIGEQFAVEFGGLRTTAINEQERR